MQRLGLVLLLAPAACGEESIVNTPDHEVCLLRRDMSTRYCIETYEAAHKDSSATSPGGDEASPAVSLPSRVPWTQITWDGARQACTAKGKRLCERDEWLDACDGAIGEDQGSVYTYGNDVVAGRCNTDGGGVEAGGRRAECKSVGGTFDQSGNVREWTGNVRAQAAARGGSWLSTQTHDCKSGDAMQILAPEDISPEVGFRCCRDE